MRLIDADTLLKQVEERRINLIDKYHADGNEWDALCAVEEMIKDTPTVESKNGEWIDRTEYEYNIECPFCHETWNVIDNCTETFNFCPNCGADMRGEE